MNHPIPIPDVSHFSASSLREYITCPKKWTLHRVERVQAAFRPIAFAMGSAWHVAVQHHLEQSTQEVAVSVDVLVDLFRSRLDEELSSSDIPVLFEDNEDVDQLTKKAREMLGVFQSEVPLPEEVIGTEVAFDTMLFDPNTGKELVPLVGSIDALVKNKGRAVVWELKTSRRRWSSDQCEFDFQSTSYRMGAESLGYADPGLSVVVTTKAKQPSVQLEELVRHPHDVEELAELAAGVLRGIQAGCDIRIRSWACKSCPWAGPCSR